MIRLKFSSASRKCRVWALEGSGMEILFSIFYIFFPILVLVYLEIVSKMLWRILNSTASKCNSKTIKYRIYFNNYLNLQTPLSVWDELKTSIMKDDLNSSLMKMIFFVCGLSMSCSFFQAIIQKLCIFYTFSSVQLCF